MQRTAIASPPLPIPLSDLIGRERELVRVTELLASHRLVTLTGPGGAGKTRLALAVAAGLQDTFADGVAFVDLAPLREPDLVLPTVARTLGLQEGGGRPVEQQLTSFLRERAPLLVLDNFEHLLTAAPRIAGLLQEAPGLRVLATSRAPLRLRGEQEFAVGPLAHPDPAGRLPVEALAQYPAVALFVQRAREVRPEFILTPNNGEAVAAICARLDGLPLALELAAARSKLLPPAALLARLEQRLPLLTGGARDAPARQQTLRDTIAWSYDPLEPGEQRLFRRLAVFVGGCTLAAAETVCALGGDLEGDILEGMASLVDKNLLWQKEGGGEPRFGMLETVREFALEQLEASGEAAAAARAHGLSFLALTEAADLESPARAAWLARFDGELPNLRAALAWTRGVADGAALQLRLVAALYLYWAQRGYGEEGSGWLDEALARTAGDASPARARALRAAGMTAEDRGDAATARVLLEQSRTLYEALGDAHGHARALAFLATASLALGDGAAALALWEESNVFFRAAGTRWELAWGLSWLGYCHFMLADLDAARAALTEGLALWDELDDEDQAAFNLRMLSYVALAHGDHADAWRLKSESLAMNQRLGQRRPMAGCATALAGILAARGQPAEAARLAGSVAAYIERLGANNLLPYDRRPYEETLASLRSRLGAAAFEAVWSAGRALPLDEALATLLESADAGQRPMQAAPTAAGVLSAREVEVLRLLAAGKSNKEIGETLVISLNTVFRHVTHIFQKTGTANRTEAATYAHRHGLAG